jgi:hypothetical protein
MTRPRATLETARNVYLAGMANTMASGSVYEPMPEPSRPRDYIGAALCLVGAVLLAGFAAAVWG